MAGAVAGGELKQEVTFAFAAQSDEADLRRLLRDNAMPGPIAITLEREPNFFLEATHSCAEPQTIVARSRGRVVCLGSCSMRERFVNGKVCRTGYLGGLRLDNAVAGRADILRRGYKFFHELQQDQPAAIYFTSIAAENVRALQFLERGLPGMPEYHFVDEFVTTVIAARSGRKGTRGFTVERGRDADIDELVAMINAHNRGHHFAPHWSAEEICRLRVLGLQSTDFWKVLRDGRMVGCAALWDQRNFKQTRVHGYLGALRWSRPWLNPVLLLLRYPRLPRPGSTLRSAMISHLACAPGDSDALRVLLAALLTEAQHRGLDYVTIGFSGQDPRLATLRRYFRFREYPSRLYVVRWPEMATVLLNDNLLNPELALL